MPISGGNSVRSLPPRDVFTANDIPFTPQLVFDPNETPDDPCQRGVERREELMGAPTASQGPGPVTQSEREFNRLTTEYYRESVWVRPGLGLQSRSICTLSSLTVLGRERPLRSHNNGALNFGLTQEEVCRALVDAANDQGGHDNTTVVIAAIGGQRKNPETT